MQAIVFLIMLRKYYGFLYIIKKRSVKNEPQAVSAVFSAGVPKRSRTSGLLLRRQSLYPTELLGHNIYILPQIRKKATGGNIFCSFNYFAV